jgi:hypothetical protein
MSKHLCRGQITASYSQVQCCHLDNRRLNLVAHRLYLSDPCTEHIGNLPTSSLTDCPSHVDLFAFGQVCGLGRVRIRACGHCIHPSRRENRPKV